MSLTSGDRSDKYHWHRRAQDSIAHGYLTNSKRPTCFVNAPTHIVKAEGCHLWDHQGKKYLDFICGLGANLLGYGHPQVNEAIIAQIKNGYSHSLATDLEVICAEKVRSMFPFIDKLRFLKTGSDACSASLKIARAYTENKYLGSDFVVSEGYHGHSDEFVSLTPPALGVPKYEDMKKITNKFSDNCIWITEPVITDYSNERFKELREKQDKSRVTIFDEIITGFRWQKHSVCKDKGFIPDIICLGKSIANGMPLSVVGGKRDVMECAEYFVSSTYAGETLSLAAAIKTMELLQTKYSISDLWLKGEYFYDKFNSISQDLKLVGYPTRGVFQGDDLTKALFFQESCKAGILFGSSFFINFPLVEHFDLVLNTVSDIFTRIKTGLVKLEGPMPTSPFAQKVRDGNN